MRTSSLFDARTIAREPGEARGLESVIPNVGDPTIGFPAEINPFAEMTPLPRDDVFGRALRAGQRELIPVLAEMALAGYSLPKRQIADDWGLELLEIFDTKSVQAYLLRSETGLTFVHMPGSNEDEDWTSYNLHALPAIGEDDLYFHAGFHTAARIVEPWLKEFRPAFTLGHSFSGAVGQLIARRLNIPGIGFGCPKVVRAPGVHAPYLCINRMDDRVCYQPRRWMQEIGMPGWLDLTPWSHAGKVAWWRPDARHPGEDHRMPNYVNITRGTEEGTWMTGFPSFAW